MTAPKKKRAVHHLVGVKRYPQCRFCRLIGLSRSSSRYESRRDSEEESNLVERLKQFVSKSRKRRRGYRLAHMHIPMEWMTDGKALNHKRVYRLSGRFGAETQDSQEGDGSPTLCCCPGGNGSQCPIVFVSDRLADVRAFRVVSLVDNVSRAYPAIKPISRGQASESVRF